MLKDGMREYLIAKGDRDQQNNLKRERHIRDVIRVSKRIEPFEKENLEKNLF